MIHERTTEPTTLQVTPGKEQKRPHRSRASHIQERNRPKQLKKSTLENQELPPRPGDRSGDNSVTISYGGGRCRMPGRRPWVCDSSRGQWEGTGAVGTSVRGTKGLRGGRRPSVFEKLYSEHPRRAATLNTQSRSATPVRVVGTQGPVFRWNTPLCGHTLVSLAPVPYSIDLSYGLKPREPTPETRKQQVLRGGSPRNPVHVSPPAFPAATICRRGGY